MTKTYIINELDSTLQLIRGTISIPPFGYAGLHEKYVDHDDVIYATQRGWAKLSDTEPDQGSLKKSVKPAISEPMVGLTFEELKAEQAAKAKAEKAMEEAAEKVGGEVVKEDDSDHVPESKPVHKAKPAKTTPKA